MFHVKEIVSLLASIKLKAMEAFKSQVFVTVVNAINQHLVKVAITEAC